MNQVSFLTENEKNYMVSLYRSIFDPEVDMEIECISSNDVSKLLYDLYSEHRITCELFVEKNTPRYLHINYKLLLKVLGIVTDELSKIFKMSVCTQCNSNDIYYLIDYTFFDHILLTGQTGSEIITYLNSNNLLPPNTLRKTFNYPIVVKFLVNLFGGTVSMQLIENEYHLLIYLPTYGTCLPSLQPPVSENINNSGTS